MKSLFRHISLISCFLIIHEVVSGQLFHGRDYWKNFRSELVLGMGASNFLGELGGRDRIGSGFIYDLEISQTRPAFSFSYRHYLKKNVGFRTSFHYGLLRGDDRLTNEPFRNNRNLHFRSILLELATQFEYHFIKESMGHRYRIKGLKGNRGIDWGVYSFLGIGGFYFNPKAKFDGEWIALQPLGTEGQGLKSGTKKYSRLSVAIPMGLGVRYIINERLSIGLELGYRITFTDYIDDVSTEYYHHDSILYSRGEVAAYLADPSLKLIDYGDMTPTDHGQQRGNPKDKDGYMFGLLTLNYKLRSRPPNWNKRGRRDKLRPSF